MPISLSDLVLLRRSINEDWPIPENVRRAIARELLEEIGPEPQDVRRVVAVARVFLTMGAANLRALKALKRVAG